MKSILDYMITCTSHLSAVVTLYYHTYSNFIFGIKLHSMFVQLLKIPSMCF